MSFNTNPANAVTYITDPSASFLKVPVRVINNLNVPRSIRSLRTHSSTMTSSG